MSKKPVVCLSGGVGGAKLLLGLQKICQQNLVAVVNTGDDFNHLGLRICPDIDTALYTLSEQSNPQLGWGRRDESWHCMEVLASLEAETWFRLGDKDLALHLERTRSLAAGETLQDFTARAAKLWDITAQILPMSNQAVATEVLTTAGYIPFQDYFVRQQCQPVCQGYRFEGAAQAEIAPAVREFLQQPLQAILIAPSNPYLSIAPILAVPGMLELIKNNGAPVIAVSPLIGGKSVKGPTAKIMNELGVDVSAPAIADFYAGLIDGFIMDSEDKDLRAQINIPVAITNTLMKTDQDKQRVAQVALDLARDLA